MPKKLEDILKESKSRLGGFDGEGGNSGMEMMAKEIKTKKEKSMMESEARMKRIKEGKSMAAKGVMYPKMNEKEKAAMGMMKTASMMKASKQDIEEAKRLRELMQEKMRREAEIAAEIRRSKG